MRRITGVAACFLMIACCLALSGCGPQPEEITKTPLPWAHMPHPNAYDTFNSAIKELKDTKAIDDAYESDSGPIGKTSKVSTMRQKAHLVRENEAALAKVRKGLKQEFCSPLSNELEVLGADFTGYRTIARLLVLEGQIKASRSDWAGAISSYQDAIQLGGAVANGSALTGRLVGIACQEIGREGMWSVVNHLSAARAEAAARRMLTISAAGVDFPETLREDKLTQLMVQKRIAGKAKSWVVHFTYGGMLAEYSAYMDRAIRDTAHPYALHPDSPPDKEDPSKPESDQTMVDIISPLYHKSRFADVRCRTENSLMIVTLALQAYLEKQGGYPASLEELTLPPHYLPRLPADPFAMSGTFHYRGGGPSYVLWSVGPDGKDDGGRAIFDPKEKPGERHRVDEDSKGDVVAGVNR